MLPFSRALQGFTLTFYGDISLYLPPSQSGRLHQGNFYSTYLLTSTITLWFIVLCVFWLYTKEVLGYPQVLLMYHLSLCVLNTTNHTQFIRKTLVGSTHSTSIHYIYEDSKHETLDVCWEILVSSEISCQFGTNFEKWRGSWSGFHTLVQGELRFLEGEGEEGGLNQFGKCFKSGGNGWRLQVDNCRLLMSHTHIHAVSC